jgi:hypothetical protein
MIFLHTPNNISGGADSGDCITRASKIWLGIPFLRGAPHWTAAGRWPPARCFRRAEGGAHRDKASDPDNKAFPL